MLANMVSSLFYSGRIETTLVKAKAARRMAERMITLGKQGGLANYRQAMAFITREDVAKRLFDEIAPKYAERNGGYTRIIRIGPRRGDAAEMAIIEMV
jgi:large subunit ribosomal protein L17